MKVLLTGAEGQLGKAFQELFNRDAIDYLATDVINTGSALDITKLDDLRNFANKNHIDLIINCAAYNAVDRAEQEWQKAFLINGLAIRNLSLVANEINATLIHYSTDYVFSGNKGIPYTILDNPKPLSKYGESKLLGEQFIQNLAKKYFLIRTSWLFGDGRINFVNKVLEWANDRDELKIVTDEVSSPTHAPDLAEITWKLFQSRAYGLYHVTNSGYCSRYQWAEYILKKMKWNGEILQAKADDFETIARRPEFSVLDNFGIRETIDRDLPSWKDASDRYLRNNGVL